MKASRKRALRAPKRKYRIRALDVYGYAIKFEADDKLRAMIALNRVTRHGVKTVDWDTLSVK